MMPTTPTTPTAPTTPRRGRRRQRRRRVRFADEVIASGGASKDVFLPLCSFSESCQPAFLSRDRIRRLWFRAEDYLQFRVQSRAASHAALAEGWNYRIAGWHGCVTNRDVDPKRGEDCPVLPEIQDSQMRKWACRSSTPSCRGLERFVSIDYARYRQSIRRRQIKAVLFAQDQLKNDPDLDISRAWEVKAKISRLLSGAPASVARRMGKADAAAVATELELYHKKKKSRPTAPKTPVKTKRRFQKGPPKTPKTPKTPTPTSRRSLAILSPLSSSYIPPSPLNVPLTPKSQETISPVKKLSPFTSPTPLNHTPKKKSYGRAPKKSNHVVRSPRSMSTQVLELR